MSIGIMEYWSIGVMAEGLISSFSILQYSNTPSLQDRDFHDPLASAISLFIVHSFEKNELAPHGSEVQILLLSMTFARSKTN
jgi:hypothetical protein